MPGKPYPSNFIEQAKDVSQGWKAIDPAFKVGDLTLTTFEGEISGITNIQDQIDALEKQITDLRNQRDAKGGGLWEMIKRIRNTIKGLYGDNSSEYELVGGTRLSERKPAVRKPKPQA